MHSARFRQALCLPQSKNRHEAECLYFGRFDADGTPVLVPEKLLDEHLYIEGPSGSGKTALALCPLIAQLAPRKDRRLVVIDMKGDSNELFAAPRRSGLPLRWFIDRVGYSTWTFNVFEQRYWSRLSPAQRAASLGAALGTIGTMAGYGVQWFQGACFAVLQHVFERVEVRSFKQLSEEIHRLVIHGKRDDLHSDIRAAGLQAYLDVSRVASVEALNVIGNPNGIDLCSVFETAQVLHICLPSAGNYAMAGVIARLFMGGLFDAAAVATRNGKVSVVVDEWQRAVAPGMLETLLTQARSCGIGYILANQTIDDLVTAEKDFRPTIYACCQLHWLFGLGSSAAQEEFAKRSGFAKTIDRTITYKPGIGGWEQASYSDRQGQIERYTLNEVKRICADPMLSFFTSHSDHGLYQYQGFPQAIRSEFHVDRDDYEFTSCFPWPDPKPECIVTKMPSLVEPEQPPPPNEPPPPIPTIGRPKPQSPKPRGSKE